MTESMSTTVLVCPFCHSHNAFVFPKVCPDCGQSAAPAIVRREQFEAMVAAANPLAEEHYQQSYLALTGAQRYHIRRLLFFRNWRFDVEGAGPLHHSEKGTF
jgi:hypothetical protein